MKRIKYVNGGIDEVDASILRLLTDDARMPMKDLANAIRLSAPSVAERVRRLEEAGVIEGYTTRIRRDAIGLPIAAITATPGCLSYVVSADHNDEVTLWVTEVWDSAESHQRPPIQAAIQQGRPLIASVERIATTTPLGGLGLNP